MNGLVYDGELCVRGDLPVPQVAADEVLIRVRLAGICGTDLQILRGYRDFRGILGHEFVGKVVDAHDCALIGRRVCGEINVVCGRCEMCRCDRSSHCRQRSVVGIQGHSGAFAEYLSLPLRNLHPVPDGLADEEAVFVEPLAAACQILGQMRIEPGEPAVVVGDGRLGNLCAQVLARAGLQVVVVGRNPAKLERFRRMGLDARHVGETLSPVDLVVDATGSHDGFRTALTLVRPRGTLVMKSTVTEPYSVDLAAIAVNEISIVGSRCGPFDQAIDLLNSKAVQVLPLVDRCYALKDGVDAMQYAGRPGVMKVLISMQEERG